MFAIPLVGIVSFQLTSHLVADRGSLGFIVTLLFLAIYFSVIDVLIPRPTPGRRGVVVGVNVLGGTFYAVARKRPVTERDTERECRTIVKPIGDTWSMKSNQFSSR